MNLETTAELFTGGEGSGCNPDEAKPRCGRPRKRGHTSLEERKAVERREEEQETRDLDKGAGHLIRLLKQSREAPESLSRTERQALRELLRIYAPLFGWKREDVPYDYKEMLEFLDKP